MMSRWAMTCQRMWPLKSSSFSISTTISCPSALLSACSSWRSAVKQANFHACVPTKSLPWCFSSSPHDHPCLIVAEPDDIIEEYGLRWHTWYWRQHRRVYNLCDRTIHLVKIPPKNPFMISYKDEQEPPQGLILSSRGLLLCAMEDDIETILTLFNRFSGAEIELPTLEIWNSLGEKVMPFKYGVRLIEKFIMSTYDNDDYSVALILEEPNINLSIQSEINLSIQSEIVVSWKKGDDHWVQLGPLNKDNGWPFLDLCSDITFYRGEFYAVDNLGDLLAFGPGQSLPRLVAGLAGRGLFPYKEYDMDVRGFLKLPVFYLVESMGRLLLLCRVKRLVRNRNYYETISFQVFEVNVDNGDAKEVHNLGGNNAVFVGTNSSFSVDASRAHGCKPNCIYYTVDYRHLYYCSSRRFKGWDKDCGVYDLTAEKFESFSDDIGSLCSPSVTAPAMWLESPGS